MSPSGPLLVWGNIFDSCFMMTIALGIMEPIETKLTEQMKQK